MFAAENGLKGDPRLQAISQAIRVVPHFPKPGSMLSFFLSLCFFLLLFVLLFYLCFPSNNFQCKYICVCVFYYVFLVFLNFFKLFWV